MSIDLSALLQDWDYQPGQVAARRFQGDDGQEKIQLRVDLGILQMNAQGRPDGKRPLGHESWFHVFQHRLNLHREQEEGDESGFVLGSEECGKLQQECIQYHHRYICFFQLEDFTAVQRDCERNLTVFQFVAEHAATEELAWSLLQFTPQLLMMRTRARGMSALKRSRHDRAIRVIEEGLNDLEEFYHDNGRDELAENSGEIGSLRHWLEEVRQRRPLSELEKLQHELDEAVRVEDYEKAAGLRDQIRKLQTSEG